tara:strand:- start:930 stop:1328 length:399 start_codon:yes stop_codon:yes gene_type:complete
MSLNFNLTKIDDHKTLCYRKVDEKGENGEPLFQLRVVTDRIIWGTMLVDVGNLKNTKECKAFFDRYCEAAAALALPVDLTLDDVLAHKGLSTNVFKTTEAKWLKRLALMLRDRVARERRWAAEKAEKASAAA